LDSSLLGLAGLIARRYGLELAIEPFAGCAPAPMGQKAQAAIAAAADALALAHIPLPSGAGHDAQCLAPVTETGMIFIPSQDGISHSALEYSDWDRCIDGANVLLRAALKLAEG
jgi:N-carbamoyl-L-amino-acid hydrolase